MRKTIRTKHQKPKINNLKIEQPKYQDTFGARRWLL